MPLTIDNVAVFSLGGAAGFLIRMFIDHLLAKSRIRQDREAKAFEEAATAFRSKVLSSLEGIYPVTRSWWNENRLPQFPQSVSKVETASAEFRYFVGPKSSFDVAIDKYRNYCQRRTYDRAQAWSCYPDMHTPGEIGPAEEFGNIVEHLLSFAEKK